MREQLRVGSALCWASAWALALAAPALYVIAPDVVTWWIGLVLVLPLLLLTAWRAERIGSVDYASGAGDGGAWAPPPDGGGPGL
jgi:hypothetical protein